ncbi:MAG: CDGSH iron-sulfur domain-containing protein [Nitrospinota bacterium]|nr:CDGSH iron-sulfur domain-containing protein [Nitrospinota bacterium]
MADKLIDPVIAKKEPANVKIGPGEFKWCGCGLSKTQPFCDGAHDGTGFGPATINLAEERELPLCQCKRTKMPPLCDGTHAKLK